MHEVETNVEIILDTLFPSPSTLEAVPGVSLSPKQRRLQVSACVDCSFAYRTIITQQWRWLWGQVSVFDKDSASLKDRCRISDHILRSVVRNSNNVRVVAEEEEIQRFVFYVPAMNICTRQHCLSSSNVYNLHPFP